MTSGEVSPPLFLTAMRCTGWTLRMWLCSGSIAGAMEMLRHSVRFTFR